jgi:type II secretory pathway pseudopilin PulG
LALTEKNVSLPQPIPSPHRRRERGYILVTLILFVALIAIAAMVLVPAIAFQVKRDHEEELIHRGVQYSRAMKHFVKKFGRYPTRVEELENTNQIRFLRKRYKDPITGKDFKILRMGDVQLAFGGGIAGATPVTGAIPPGAGVPGGPGFLTQGGLGKLAGGVSAGINPSGAPTGAGTPAGSDQAAAQNSGDPGSDSATVTPGAGTDSPAAGPTPPGTKVQETSAPGAQVFGGGPMVGVASTSKAKSIRVFNKKDHYDQWQFIYDPSSDRGGLLTTPNQPPLQGATAVQAGAPGAPATPGAPGAFGGISGQPGPGTPPGQPTPPGVQPPPMPPDQ